MCYVRRDCKKYGPTFHLVLCSLVKRGSLQWVGCKARMDITRRREIVPGFVRIVKCGRLGWVQARVCS